MTTARLQWLWSGLSRGYECAQKGIDRIRMSKEYARAKVYTNIAICSSMAVGYFSNLGSSSSSATSEWPSPAEYVLTGITCAAWWVWEYQKDTSAHTEEKMLEDSEKVITDVNNLYLNLINQMSEESKELKRDYHQESKSIVLITNNSPVKPLAISTQLFDSIPIVYLRAMINGGVFATTIYQYLNSGETRNFLLGVSMLGATLWYNDAIRATIAKHAKFAEIKANFPTAREKLNFINQYTTGRHLENTVAQIHSATEGRIQIQPELDLEKKAMPVSECVVVGDKKSVRCLRAMARAAAQAESIRILTHILLPTLAPAGEHILAGVMFLAGTPRAYFEEKHAIHWSHELTQFRQGIESSIKKVRHVQDIIDTGHMALDGQDMSTRKSLKEEKILQDDEVDGLLAMDFEKIGSSFVMTSPSRMFVSAERQVQQPPDLELGLSRATLDAS